jgi:nicotinamide-nucleotide amidase
VTAGEAPGTSSARRLVAAAAARGLTLATAESLTGGAVAAAIVGVPGASEVFRGGVVAYATDLKREWLAVPAELLARRGPVDPDVAAAMADGVRERARADLGLATTGVAGPGPADGHPAGTVHVAVAQPGASRVRSLVLPGDRPAVRAAATAAALSLALTLLT